MSETEKLLSLQEYDLRIREINRELKDIPVRKHKEKETLQQHHDAIKAQDDLVKARQADLKKLELEAAGFSEKITKLRQQQYEIKTNKEFKAIEDEIKAIQQSISGLEDKELVIMGAIDSLKDGGEERHNALKEEERKVAEYRRRLDERAEQLAADMAREKTLRDEAASHIDNQWLSAYETIFSRKEPALVPMEDGICGGCRLKLAPAVGHEAKKRLSIVTCNFCGRMLY